MPQTHTECGPLGALLLAYYWIWCNQAKHVLRQLLARFLDLRSPSVKLSADICSCLAISITTCVLPARIRCALNIRKNIMESGWCYDVCVRVLLQSRLCILGRFNQAMQISRARDKYLNRVFLYLHTHILRKSI
jgi:hypothetical protein